MFFQLIEEGIVVFLVNAVISGLLFLAFRPYVRERVEEWLSGYISDYIRDQLESALQNPERTAKVLSPLFNAVLKELMKDFERQNKPQTLNLFGFKIPAEIAQLFIERFLSREGEKNINPFS
jgi:hypothetical protein